MIVGGVPMLGVVDMDADVTIMGGSMFKRFAAAAKLHKRDFNLLTRHHITNSPFGLMGGWILM